jgi:hypothetical protein
MLFEFGNNIDLGGKKCREKDVKLPGRLCLSGKPE